MDHETALQKALGRAWNMSKKNRALEAEQQDVESELELVRRDRYAFCSLERSEVRPYSTIPPFLYPDFDSSIHEASSSKIFGRD